MKKLPGTADLFGMGSVRPPQALLPSSSSAEAHSVAAQSSATTRTPLALLSQQHTAAASQTKLPFFNTQPAPGDSPAVIAAKIAAFTFETLLSVLEELPIPQKQKEEVVRQVRAQRQQQTQQSSESGASASVPIPTRQIPLSERGNPHQLTNEGAVRALLFGEQPKTQVDKAAIDSLINEISKATKNLRAIENGDVKAVPSLLRQILESVTNNKLSTQDPIAPLIRALTEFADSAENASKTNTPGASPALLKIPAAVWKALAVITLTQSLEQSAAQTLDDSVIGSDPKMRPFTAASTRSENIRSNNTKALDTTQTASQQRDLGLTATEAPLREVISKLAAAPALRAANLENLPQTLGSGAERMVMNGMPQNNGASVSGLTTLNAAQLAALSSLAARVVVARRIGGSFDPQSSYSSKRKTRKQQSSSRGESSDVLSWFIRLQIDQQSPALDLELHQVKERGERSFLQLKNAASNPDEEKEIALLSQFSQWLNKHELSGLFQVV